MHFALSWEISLIFDDAFFVESYGLKYNGKKITVLFSKSLLVSLGKFLKWKIQKPSFVDVGQKMFLENFAVFIGKHLCWNHFSKKFQFYTKETPTQVFFCIYCEVFNNSFFNRTHPVTASKNLRMKRSK